MNHSIEVERIIEAHGRERPAVMAILQDVQDRFNWICEDHLRQVAESLGLPLTQVYGMATFYKALSLVPRGRTIVRVCLGTACHVRGAQLVLDELERRLEVKAGQTTPDLSHTLESVNCVGACGMAPVVIVGGTYHPGVKPHRAGKLIERTRSRA
jgi:NADH:ubiquinone oxidoreductase subunit E